MKPIFFLKELSLNRNLGMLSFMAQRLTGVALVFYLIMHLYTVGAIVGGPASFDHSVEKYDNFFGHIIEYLLLICVAVHLLNGLRIMWADFFSATERPKKLLAYAVAAGVLIAVVGIFYMIPEIR